MRTQMLQSDFLAECKRRHGAPRAWAFICPMCKTRQTIQMLFDAGLSQDGVHGAMAFSCIGRYQPGIGCDWTLGGLLQMHELEIIMDQGNGNVRPAFEIAPAPETIDEVLMCLAGHLKRSIADTRTMVEAQARELSIPFDDLVRRDLIGAFEANAAA